MTEMTVALAPSPGGPEVLTLAQRPRPVPGPGEILIEVVAAGVNGADLAQRRGVYPPPPGASDILGLEVSGRVAEVNGETELKVGDEVCALLTGGGYAGYVTAPVGQVLPLPKGVSLAEGAALMETLATVWTNVFEDARFKAGDSILVHGGASGIGMTAIQLAKALGASAVFATVSSDEKAAAVETLGATAINHRAQDFAEAIKAGTKDGVDVILDVVGGSYLDRNLKCLRAGGRMCTIAINGGRTGELDFARMMMKRLQLTASTLRSRPIPEKARLVAEVRRHCWPLIEAGQVKPIVDSTFPLAEAAKAHARMEAGLHVGKVILTL